MARPRKPVDYEEELMKVDAQITKYKNTITELQQRRKELVAEKERNELDVLYQAVSQSGRPVDEIVQMIRQG